MVLCLLKIIKKRLNSGADLVQLYTGFIYEGPKLIKDILNHLQINKDLTELPILKLYTVKEIKILHIYEIVSYC